MFCCVHRSSATTFRILASKWQKAATGPKKAIGRSQRTFGSFSGLYKLFHSFSLLKDTLNILCRAVELLKVHSRLFAAISDMSALCYLVRFVHEASNRPVVIVCADFGAVHWQLLVPISTRVTTRSLDQQRPRLT